MEFKDIVKKLREERGLTQKELAHALDVTDRTVSAWECGTRTPDFDRMPLIADYFNTTTDYLYGRMNAIDNDHYFDIEVRQLASFLHDHPEYKTLFEKSKRVSPDNIERTAKMLDVMNETSFV